MGLREAVKRSSVTDWMIAGFTFVLAICAIWQFCVMNGQLDQMKKQLPELHKAAKAAEDGAKTAKDTFDAGNQSSLDTLTEMRKQSRAMQDAANAQLGLVPPTERSAKAQETQTRLQAGGTLLVINGVVLDEIGPRVGITVQFQSSNGHALKPNPAVDISFQPSLPRKNSPKPLPFTILHPEGCETPNSAQFHWCMAKVVKDMPESLYRAFIMGRNNLYISGMVDYRDDVGDEPPIRLCKEISAKDAAVGVQMKECPESAPHKKEQQRKAN